MSYNWFCPHFLWYVNITNYTDITSNYKDKAKPFLSIRSKIFVISGMSSIYTLVAMALIRYSSVVKFERSWHIATHEDFLTSRYVQFIWLLALLMALPPTFGIGQYIQDVGMIRYLIIK